MVFEKSKANFQKPIVYVVLSSEDAGGAAY
jgi:hypothetical protein